MSHHVKNIGILVARPGRRDELRVLLEGLIEPSRNEPGNLRYDLWQDQSDPDRLVLDELYADEDALKAHRVTTHFQAYLAVINDLAERTALALRPAVVA